MAVTKNGEEASDFTDFALPDVVRPGDEGEPPPVRARGRGHQHRRAKTPRARYIVPELD
jgi:hypothetical protein